jgi:hypothetical protein
MSLRKRIGLVVVWAVSIVAAGVWAHAQTTVPQTQAPTVLSGNDLGFRIDSRKGNTPVGTIVVRVNGQWVEADFSVGMKRLTSK